jgi:hypothetical protein
MTFTASAILVLLLVILVVVTLSKTRWGRSDRGELKKRGEPRDKDRVSSEEDES